MYVNSTDSRIYIRLKDEHYPYKNLTILKNIKFPIILSRMEEEGDFYEGRS